METKRHPKATSLAKYASRNKTAVTSGTTPVKTGVILDNIE